MSLAFVRGIHQWPVDSSHKGPVMWKMFPFNNIVMNQKEMINIEITEVAFHTFEGVFSETKIT